MRITEDYHFIILLTTLFHIVFFFVLFFSFRYSVKPLLLASPSALSIIHATVMDASQLPRPVTSPPSTVEKKLLVKPVLVRQSPLSLPTKAGSSLKKLIDSPVPIKTNIKKLPTIKIRVADKKVPIQTIQKPVVTKNNKNEKASVAVSHLKSLQIAKKDVQKLLEQEIKTIRQREVDVRGVRLAIEKYRKLILQSIAQQWIIPPGIDKHLETQLLIRLAPSGAVLDVAIVKSSGNLVLDRSAQTAVYKASPLPVPKDNSLFNNFRQIRLTIRPESLLT